MYKGIVLGDATCNIGWNDKINQMCKYEGKCHLYYFFYSIVDNVGTSQKIVR